MFEPYSTHCYLHGSLSFVLFPSHFPSDFTSIWYCWPFIAHIDSSFQLWGKCPAVQQLTALPKLSPPTSCSGSHSSLTSSTCTHPVTKTCEFQYCFHLIAYLHFQLCCLANIPLTFSACEISLRLWHHPYHSGSSSTDTFATL